MTLRLILVRHAKSDWGSPSLDDHDRPLNKRGRRDAPRMGAWLAARGYVPDRVTVSSATRAQQTWEGIASGLGESAAKVITARDLYHAAPETILKHAQSCDATTQMIIGHNPGIGDFARRILHTAPAHARFFDYPTCATLVVGFSGRGWDDLQWGKGRALAFVTPHNLPQ